MSEWVFSDRTQRSRIQLASCVWRSHRSRGFFAIRITKRGGAKRTWGARTSAIAVSGSASAKTALGVAPIVRYPHTRDGLRGNALRAVVQ